MIFGSDNWAGAAPQISAALAEHSAGMARAYGDSDLDARVEATFAELFQHEVAVFFVGTGTAANSLAMAAVGRPGGMALCHRGAHMAEDECGGPELFMAGGRLVLLDGAVGKIDPDGLKKELARFDPPFLHHGRATALSLTQSTEVGTVYSIEEIRRLADMARALSLPVHMDGSRFANALVHLDVSPADMTWRAGVDMVSFGGTKNGCWCAEALVFFNTDLAADMAYHRKRAGHLFSKSRFIAAQFAGYFADDLWLDLARHSNAIAERLRKGIDASGKARLAWPSQANEVFFIAAEGVAESLQAAGAAFHRWPMPHDVEGEAIYRLVASFASTEDDADRFIEALNDA